MNSREDLRRLNVHFCVRIDDTGEARDLRFRRSKCIPILEDQFLVVSEDSTRGRVEQLKEQIMSTWKDIRRFDRDDLLQGSIKEMDLLNSEGSLVPDRLMISLAFEDKEHIRAEVYVSAPPEGQPRDYNSPVPLLAAEHREASALPERNRLTQLPPFSPPMIASSDVEAVAPARDPMQVQNGDRRPAKNGVHVQPLPSRDPPTGAMLGSSPPCPPAFPPVGDAPAQDGALPAAASELPTSPRLGKPGAPPADISAAKKSSAKCRRGAVPATKPASGEKEGAASASARPTPKREKKRKQPAAHPESDIVQTPLRSARAAGPSDAEGQSDVAPSPQALRKKDTTQNTHKKKLSADPAAHAADPKRARSSSPHAPPSSGAAVALDATKTIQAAHPPPFMSLRQLASAIPPAIIPVQRAASELPPASGDPESDDSSDDSASTASSNSGPEDGSVRLAKKHSTSRKKKSAFASLVADMPAVG